MDVFEARLACLHFAGKKYEGMGGATHPAVEPKKIIDDAEAYAEFVLGKQVESESGRKKGADERK